MKYILAIFVSAMTASGADVQFALTNWDRTLTTNSIRLTPLKPQVSGVTLQVGYPRTYSTVGGKTNLNIWGDYQMSILGTAWTNIQLKGIPDDSNIYNFTAFIPTNSVGVSAAAPAFVTPTQVTNIVDAAFFDVLAKPYLLYRDSGTGGPLLFRDGTTTGNLLFR